MLAQGAGLANAAVGLHESLPGAELVASTQQRRGHGPGIGNLVRPHDGGAVVRAGQRQRIGFRRQQPAHGVVHVLQHGAGEDLAFVLGADAGECHAQQRLVDVGQVRGQQRQRGRAICCPDSSMVAPSSSSSQSVSCSSSIAALLALLSQALGFLDGIEVRAALVRRLRSSCRHGLTAGPLGAVALPG
jgi:hypothetical protein